MWHRKETCLYNHYSPSSFRLSTFDFPLQLFFKCFPYLQRPLVALYLTLGFSLSYLLLLRNDDNVLTAMNDCAKRPIYKWLTKTEINVRAKDRSRITWCLFATVSHCCMAIKIFFVNLLYVYQIVLLVWCWTHAQFWYRFLLSHFMTRVQGNPKKIFDLQPCLLSIRFHSCVSSLDVQEKVFKRCS